MEAMKPSKLFVAGLIVVLCGCEQPNPPQQSRLEATLVATGRSSILLGPAQAGMRGPITDLVWETNSVTITNYVTITNEVPQIVWAYTNCPPEPKLVFSLTNVGTIWLSQYERNGYVPVFHRVDDAQWARMTNFFGGTNNLISNGEYSFYTK